MLPEPLRLSHGATRRFHDSSRVGKGLSTPPPPSSDYKGETPSKSAAKTKTGACKRLIKMAEMYLPVRRKPTTKAAGLDRRRNKQIRDRRVDRQADGREPAEVSGTAPA